MKSPKRQSGISLVTGLIMLTVLTLIVVATVRSSNIGLRIARNAQKQQEMTASGRQAIEAFISTDFVTTLPTGVTTVPVSVTGAGTADYTASIPVPACLSSVPLSNTDLDPTIPSDAACMGSDSVQNAGINIGGRPGTSGNQWCYAQSWDVAATITDAGSGASATSHQGIAERVMAGTACP